VSLGNNVSCIASHTGHGVNRTLMDRPITDSILELYTWSHSFEKTRAMRAAITSELRKIKDRCLLPPSFALCLSV